jgi:hypothetical protein
MQSPFIVQKMIETQLLQVVKTLPAWLSPQCNLSLKKFLCGSQMLLPEPLTFKEAIHRFDQSSINRIQDVLKQYNVSRTLFYDSIFHLPSYPIKDVCLNYTQDCQGFITQMFNNTSNILNPKCSDTRNGLFLYPTKMQTIETLVLKNISVNFQTSPNTMMNSSDSHYKPACPEGFVVPDTPDSDRNKYISGMSFFYMLIYDFRAVIDVFKER